MARIFLTALFSLLLVGMQEEALVHAVDHLRAQVLRGHDASLQTAVSGDCLECALLVSGGTPAPASENTTTPVMGATERVAFSFESSPAIAPPAFYNSRGPPAIL
jgi:hypothetical protein